MRITFGLQQVRSAEYWKQKKGLKINKLLVIIDKILED